MRCGGAIPRAVTRWPRACDYQTGSTGPVGFPDVPEEICRVLRKRRLSRGVGAAQRQTEAESYRHQLRSRASRAMWRHWNIRWDRDRAASPPACSCKCFALSKTQRGRYRPSWGFSQFDRHLSPGALHTRCMFIPPHLLHRKRGFAT